jgi:diguanylate cyclase (GGDEF)-like protein/PAS domain S-box-containing protein
MSVDVKSILWICKALRSAKNRLDRNQVYSKLRACVDSAIEALSNLLNEAKQTKTEVITHSEQIADITGTRQFSEFFKLESSIFASLQEAMFITSADGTILDVNPAFTHITGYEPGEVIGGNPCLFHSNKQDLSFYRNIWSEIDRNGYWSGEIWNCKKSQEVYPVQMSITAVFNQVTGSKYYVYLFSDISIRKQREDDLISFGNHDLLTSLPNRNSLEFIFANALKGEESRGKNFYVMYLDLDGFKFVNDTYGHQSGDQVLKVVAKRMRNELRERDVLARVGGDEFVGLLQDPILVQNCEVILQRLSRAVSQPIALSTHKGTVTVRITTSIGVAKYPQDSSNSNELIGYADAAMYYAKQKGKNQIAYFDQINTRASNA